MSPRTTARTCIEITYVACCILYNSNNYGGKPVAIDRAYNNKSFVYTRIPHTAYV